MDERDLLLTQLAKFPTPTIFEAARRQGALNRAIKPLHYDMRIAGTAFTVRCSPFDNSAIHQALEYDLSGQVLVISTAPGEEGTYCGGIIVRAAKARGAAGIVLDGYVRDFREILDQNFPVFCRGSAVAGSSKSAQGELQAPVVCGGTAVQPGDLVIGDEDGVVVIAASVADEVYEAACKRDAWEQMMVEGIQAGKTTMEMLKAKEARA